MLPNTKLTVGDVLLILRRRVRLILVTAALVSAGTAGAALLLPNHYRSETLILVVPQRVPETYVKSTVTAKIEDRLLSISQQILSRTRLERIIEDFDLYAVERRTRLMETIVETYAGTSTSRW
jgi:polysaccharide biosynthesis transport protein